MAAAEVKQLLFENARRKKRHKHGGNRLRISLDEADPQVQSPRKTRSDSTGSRSAFGGNGIHGFAHAGVHPNRTRVRSAQRAHRGHRPRRKLGLRGRLSEHARVGEPHDPGRRKMQRGRRSGKKRLRGILKSMATRREFLKYFNKTMAHPFNWTDTGKPLQKVPRRQFVPPHRREVG